FTTQYLVDVNTTLTNLIGKTVNEQEVTLASLNEGSAVIDRLNTLEAGRFTALVNDLEDNGDYSSFTQMSITLYQLLQFREAIQTTVNAANSGSLEVSMLQDVADNLTALGTLNVSGVPANLIATDAQTGVAVINTLDAGRITALINDVHSNAQYSSFTQLSEVLDQLVQFRLAVQTAVNSANSNSLEVSMLQDVADNLTALGTLNVSGVPANLIEEDAQAGVALINTLDSQRITALINDVHANEQYSSFEELSLLLNDLVQFRFATQEFVNTVNNNQTFIDELNNVLSNYSNLEGLIVNGNNVNDIVGKLTQQIDFINLVSTKPRFIEIQEDLFNNSYSSFTQAYTQLWNLVNTSTSPQIVDNSTSNINQVKINGLSNNSFAAIIEITQNEITELGIPTPINLIQYFEIIGSIENGQNATITYNLSGITNRRNFDIQRFNGSEWVSCSVFGNLTIENNIASCTTGTFSNWALTGETIPSSSGGGGGGSTWTTPITTTDDNVTQTQDSNVTQEETQTGSGIDTTIEEEEEQDSTSQTGSQTDTTASQETTSEDVSQESTQVTQEEQTPGLGGFITANAPTIAGIIAGLFIILAVVGYFLFAKN
ncbi:MAG: hypothetical protein LAT82_05980, partial [Nanoarchaeota archaeon]|nr:hypothetical protein [Nanoarchaeota archaeon]